MVRKIWLLAFSGMFAFWGGVSVAPASAQDVKAFVALDNDNEAEMRFALTYAEKLCQVSADTKFEILGGGKGVLMFSKSKSPVVEECAALLEACPAVKLYACKETVDKMTAAGGEHTPDLLPGVTVISCDKRFAELTAEGYFKIDTAS